MQGTDLALDSRPESVVVQFTGSGDQEIIAAVAGIRYVVTGFLVGSDTDTVLTWKSATTVICGGLPVAARSPGGQHVHRGDYLFKTAIGAALNLNASISATVGGVVKVHKHTT